MNGAWMVGLRRGDRWSLDVFGLRFEHPTPAMRQHFAACRRFVGPLCLSAAWLLLGGCGPKAGPTAPVPTAPVSTATNQIVRTGEEIYQACLLCHSTREMQRGPIIDGLPQWYAKDQLLKFQRGVRGRNPENKSEALMAAGMATLRNDSELRVVAEYLSQLPPQRHRRSVHGDAQRGRGLYQSCVPCHGPRGEGNELVKGPPLRLLEDWYLLDQMRKIQYGWRISDPKDLQLPTMRGVISAFKEQDFHDVVAHITEDLAAP